MLHIYTLGALRILDGDRPIPSLRSHKNDLLLAYLAIHCGHESPRDLLATLLWPEADEKRGRANLRKALSRIKQRLPESALDIQRKTVRLIASETWVDALVIDQKIATTVKHAHANRASCDQCAATLAEVVTLYDGEFMSGYFADDSDELASWLRQQRQQRQQQQLASLATLTQYALKRGELRQAEKYAFAQLAIDPLREGSVRQLIQLYQQQGRSDDARQTLESYRERLWEEIGTEPAADLVALVERPAVAVTTEMVRVAFIGRYNELATLNDYLNDARQRLITVTGMGGVGKTTLARRAGEHVPAAVFVPLLGFENDVTVQQLARSVLNALGGANLGSADALHDLRDHLRRQPRLLILDNVEHLPLTVTRRFVEQVLQIGEVRVLVTSRERLGLKDETLLPLTGLPVPAAAGDNARSYASVQLFEERARRLVPQFRVEGENVPHVVAICRAVEGLPLAIELAARWIEHYTSAEIASEIAWNPSFLREPFANHDHHASLQFVFEQSWQRLSEPLRDILAQLTVFAGTFDRQAAMAVADASVQQLAALVSQSLLERVAPGLYRLHSVIRQLSAEKLPNPTLTQRRHADYFFALLTRLSTEDGAKWLAVRDDVVLAWQQVWAVAEVDQLPHLVELDSSTNQLPAAAELLQQLAQLPHFAAHHATIHLQQAVVANRMGRPRRAAAFATQTIERNPPTAIAWKAHFQHSLALKQLGQLAAAQNALETAIELTGDPAPELQLQLGRLHLAQWQFDKVYPLVRTARRAFREAGDKQQELAAQQALGELAMIHNGPAVAQPYFVEALHRARSVGNSAEIASLLNKLGELAYRQGHFAEAVRYYDEATTHARLAGDPLNMATALRRLGVVYTDVGAADEAHDYFGAAEAEATDGNQLDDGWTLLGRAMLYANTAAFSIAGDTVVAGSAIFERLRFLPGRVFGSLYLGHISVITENWRMAHFAFEDALELGAARVPMLALEAEIGRAFAAAKRDEWHTTSELDALFERGKTYAMRESARWSRSSWYLARLLHLQGDSRAMAVVVRSAERLETAIPLLPDDVLPEQFIDQLPHHADLVRWAQVGMVG